MKAGFLGGKPAQNEPVNVQKPHSNPQVVASQPAPPQAPATQCQPGPDPEPQNAAAALAAVHGATQIKQRRKKVSQDINMTYHTFEW